MERKVAISFPIEGGYYHTSKVVVADNPYQVVDTTRSQWPQWPQTENHPYHQQPLEEIIPIHNPDGIKEINQISKMVNQILHQRKAIFEPDGAPNLKLVVVPGNRLILFDGHHSILAYILSGKKTLADTAHLIISANDGGPITPEEISYFFPENTRGEIIKDWDKYVVNWQAKGSNKIAQRSVESVGDLAKQVTALVHVQQL